MSSDGGTNRPLPSIILLGIVDFVCILMAAESYNKLQIERGTTWLAIGLVASSIGYYWPQIKKSLGVRVKAKSVLPQHRPQVLPVEYMKSEKSNSSGLYVRNPGYDALDVEIPSVRIGRSGYNLVFPERRAQFGERSGNAFFEAWLESIEQGTLPGRDGSALHEIMRTDDIEAVNFAIIYKDTDFRSYKTNCAIERTNRTRNGLEVKAISQEMVTL